MDHRINFVYPYVYQISEFRTLTPAFGWEGRKSESKIENDFFKTCKSFLSCYKLIYISASYVKRQVCIIDWLYNLLNDFKGMSWHI